MRNDAIPIGSGIVDSIIYDALARIVCHRPNCGGRRPLTQRRAKSIYLERRLRIFSEQAGYYSLKRLDVRPPIQCNQRPIYASCRLARHDRQRPIVGSCFICVPMLPAVSQSELLESEKVARVQLKGTLQISRGLVPVAFAAVDHAGVSEYISAVGQCAPGDSELAASPPVIAEPVVVINGQSEVGFARIGLQAKSCFHGRFGQI